MDNPLATSRDLASFHHARSTVYHALAEVLASASRRAEIEVDLRATGHQLAIELADELHALPRDLGVSPFEEGHLRQLRVMGVLAKESARAIQEAELSEAAVLCELQRSFLERHAGESLRHLAAVLRTHGQPWIRAIGGWLQRMVSEDAQALAGFTSRGSNPTSASSFVTAARDPVTTK